MLHFKQILSKHFFFFLHLHNVLVVYGCFFLNHPAAVEHLSLKRIALKKHQ